MKRMYKVLILSDGKLYSPFSYFNYGDLDKVIGQQFICDYSNEFNNECNNGFYATEIEGLIYSLNNSSDNKVFEVEVGGKEAFFDKYNHCFEKQKIIRMLPDEEVRQLIKEQSDKMDWDYYKICYPFNPLNVEVKDVDEKTIELLREVKKVGDVYDFVWRSIMYYPIIDFPTVHVIDGIKYPVWDFIKYSLIDSDIVFSSIWHIKRSVLNSVYAQIGSCFPNIKKWKGIEHKEGEYPFQCYIDLHELGFIPTFDGKMWRLHAGRDLKVVFEIKDSDL